MGLAQEVPPLYDLYAVSNHFGGLGGGHYTAFARLPTDGNRWYEFDDAQASPVNQSRIVSPAAYLLFYRRCREASIDPGAPPPCQPAVSSP